MMYEIIFYGRGGQGGVTAANILVHAALYQKLYGQGFPFFGAERRGAPVMAFARISDKPIVRHGMFYEADILVILDHKLIDIGATKKVYVRDNGYVIVNMPSDYEIDYGKFNILGKARFYGVNAKKIALENKLVVAGWPVVNTSMLGALSKATKIISVENIMKAIKSYFGGRVGEANAKAAFQAYNETPLIREVNM
ncbi:2-oxoacid:acceptor oxidoreductase family protein [Staphylothermus hellenicus]|nr:2-oxoacid:acceptor oxidoreductase family protein [Staphylothermus hellenicus]